jgi:flagellar biosynthesis protein FlhB
MSQEKSHQPTDKKIKDARDKGQVAVSQVPHQVCGLLALGALLPLIGLRLWLNSAALIECGLTAGLDSLAGCTGIIRSFIQELVLLPLVLLAGTQTLVGLFQTGWNLSFHSLKLDPAKLSPVAGFQRIWKALQWFPFELLKFFFTAVFVLLLLMLAAAQLSAGLGLTDNGALELAGQVLRLNVLGIVLVLIPVLVADVFVQRYKQRQELRMTHQEVREEYKNSEGDPFMKARRSALHQSISREAMVERIKKAKVILVARDNR